MCVIVVSMCVKVVKNVCIVDFVVFRLPSLLFICTIIVLSHGNKFCILVPNMRYKLKFCCF